MYYDAPVEADDGNCDKVSLSSAEDLPWELMQSAGKVRKPQDNTEMAQNPESRIPEKIESPKKRIRQETKG